MAERPIAGDDALATMNDHLARFFQHADSLLREWQTYSDELRASLDAQLQTLGDTVAGAVEDSARTAAQKVDAHIDRSVGQAVAGSLNSLRRELDTLARLASQTAARPQGADRGGATSLVAPRARFSSPILWALVTANVMLAVLIGFGVRDCRSSAVDGSRPSTGTQATGDGAAAVDARVDAAVGITRAVAIHPDRATAICSTLAQAYDADAAGDLVAAAAAAVCDEDSVAKVVQTLGARLDPEAPDAGESGAKPGPKPGANAKAKAKANAKDDDDDDGDAKAKDAPGTSGTSNPSSKSATDGKRKPAGDRKRKRKPTLGKD